MDFGYGSNLCHEIAMKSNVQCCGSEAINFGSGSRSYVPVRFIYGSYLPGHYGSVTDFSGCFRSGFYSYIFIFIFARLIITEHIKSIKV